MSEFAIAHLAYYPLRKEAKHQSENVSQVIFGETFEILESRKNWHRIRLLFDTYEGWIDSEELLYLSEEEVAAMEKENPVYASGFFQQIRQGSKSMTIGFGSRLPFWDGESFALGKEHFVLKGEVLQASSKLTNPILIERAKSLLGVAYLWGGRSTFGIDCSGFVQALMKLAGIHLPRDAWQQKERGEQMALSEAREADLAFFKNEEGRTTHVGLVMQDAKIIHASGKVRIDTLDEKGIFNRERSVYTHELEIIKRLR
jgi:hypothetical protein